MAKRMATMAALLAMTVNLAVPTIAGTANAATADTADTVVSTAIDIRADVAYQTIDNFGASDAWSMDPIGKEWSDANKTAIADLLFSTDKGIGLSAWRFNIGAGSAETDKSIIGNPWRRADTFKQEENGEYDWTKQSGQQWFLQAAHDRGVKDLIAFVNSPPVWMTKNGHAQPDASVGSTNLKDGYEGKFAGFLADVLEHFDQSGIHFNYISPINEPTWDWNGAGQEGNRYNNEDIVRVIDSLYAELQSRSLSTEIAAPEAVEILSLLDDDKFAEYMSATGNTSSTQYSSGSNAAGTGKYREYIKDLLGNPDVAAKIANKIDYHSYWSDTVSANNGDRLGELRKLLRQNLQSTLPGSSAWMSEYSILGDVGEMNGNGRDLGIDPALLMARTLHYDLSVANASAWQWWTAVSNVDYKDGLIYTDYAAKGDEQTIYPAKTLWALGNYSKFIRPGAKRVSLAGLAENDPMGLMGSAYLHEGNSKITSVYVNYTNEDKPVTIHIDSLPDGKKAYHLTPYVTSAGESLQQHDMVTPDADGDFHYTIPARSIVTLDGSYAAADQVPDQPVVKAVKAWNKAAEVTIGETAGAESYKIVYGTSPTSLDQTASPVTGTSYTLTGLTNQSTYYMQVIAVNANGESAPSDTATATPMLSPPDPVTVSAGDGQATIAFIGDKNVPHYWAKWGSSSGTYDRETEIAGQEGVYQGSIDGLVNGQSYYVVIEARDGDDKSAASRESVVVPTVAPPSKLIAIPGDGSVQLEFPAVAGSVGYRLEVTPENGTPTETELQTNAATVDRLANGQPYSFSITSLGAGGAGQSSISAQATPQAENSAWADDFENESSSLDAFRQDVSVWKLEDGLLKHASGGDNRGELSVKDVKIIDGTISVTAKHAEPGADWGVVFRGTDYDHAYAFGFENGSLYLRKNGANMADTIPFSAKLGQLYLLKVVLAGPRIQAYADGELMYDVSDNAYSGGMVGLHSWDDAQFSYMKVTRPDGMTASPDIWSLRPGSHQIELKYAEVDGASSYTVSYGTDPDSLTMQADGGEGKATVTGLDNNTVYYFKVTASDGTRQTESGVQSGSPRDNQQPQLLYYVDAGDGSPTALEDGEALGTLNGSEDQPYGTDPVTGQVWGYAADDNATWAKTDAGDAYDTIRQYDGNETGKGLAYKFKLPNGTYRVTVGFFDPWNDANRKMDLTINGTTMLTDYVAGGNKEAKTFDSIGVTNGELEVKVVKKADSKPMLSWIKVEKNLLYDVDAGDSSPDTPEDGEQFGVMNSREEQAYQEDPATGYKWGYEADDNATWAYANTVRWSSIRQYDGDTNGHGLSYRFEVPNGVYNLNLGFDDPWDSADRTMDVEVEGQKALTDYVTGAGQDVKRIVGVSVTDGELDVKLVKMGNSKPMISWLQVELDSGTPERPVIKRAAAGDSKVTLYFDETIHAAYDIAYGTDPGNLDRHLSVPGDANQYTIDGLTNGTSYSFAMATVRGDAVSPRSETVGATPTGPADPDLYYFVDAGAPTVQPGVTLGSRQSVPDQLFGKDPVTGNSWGYAADDGLTWAKSDETDPYLSIRQYDGNETGKGLAYQFDVPRGTYEVQLGFDDPWDSATRAMDVYIQDEMKLQNYVVGDKRETKTFTVDVNSDLLVVKLVKAGSDKPGIGWLSVRYLNPLPGSEGPTTPTTPVTPTTPEHHSPGIVQIGTPAIESGTAKVTVGAKALDEAFGQSNAARIEIPAADGVKEYETRLPIAALTAERGRQIAISTALGTVTVPSNMLGSYAGLNAADVSVSIAKADIGSLSESARATIGSRPVIELTLKANGSAIAWNDPNAPVAVSIPYTPTADELANPDSIVVLYVDGDGKMIAVPSGKYDPATGTVAFKTTHFSRYAVAYVRKSFGDLAHYGWAQASIEAMASKGVIRGTSGSTFAPGDEITRADFVQLLVHTLGLTAAADGQFADVSPEAYYAEAAAIARELGIATGVDGERFDPLTAITRQDAMVMIERALKAAKLDLTAGTERELADFADRGDVAAYARQSVATLLKNAIVSGDGSRVNPHGNTTRAETAVLMYRIYKLLP